MRILYIVHGFPPQAMGGTELHVLCLARQLSRRHDVRVLCREADPESPEYAVRDDVVEGISVTRINYNFRDVDRYEMLYQNERIDDLIDGYVVGFDPDVVHIHHLTGLSWGAVKHLRERRQNVVMTLHDYWFGCPRGQRLTPELFLCRDIDRDRCVQCMSPHLKSLYDARPPDSEDDFNAFGRRCFESYDRGLEELFEEVDLFLTPSAFHREMYLKAGVEPTRIRVLENGIPATAIAGRRRRAWPPKRIGYIGTVIPSKGVQLLVDAYNLMEDPSMELHFHGEVKPFHEDTEHFDRLKASVKDKERVFFHGRYRNVDVGEILQDLDIIVVPSIWYESFSLTIREGFLAGVPVVASDLGAMREAIHHRDTGLLFRPGSAEDLAEKLRSLRKSSKLYRRLVMATPHVRTEVEMARACESVYREVVDRRSSRHWWRQTEA